MKPADPRYRVLYAVWIFLECLAFDGLVFGWASLVFVFKDEGIYSELCDGYNDTQTGYSWSVGDLLYNATYIPDLNSSSHHNDGDKPTCEAQDAMLNLIFTIATTIFCVAPCLVAYFSFKYGTRPTRLISCTMFVTGSLMVAFASGDVTWLLFPGTALMTSSGIIHIMTCFQVANLFPVMGSFVVGIICGGFESSTGMMQMIKLGYDGGISRQTSFIILAASHLLTLVSTFFFLPKGVIKKHDEMQPLCESNGKATLDDEVSIGTPSVLTLKSIVFSRVYVIHITWFSILQLRYMFLVNSLNPMMELMLNLKEEVNEYTNITAYIQFGVLIAAPAAGAFHSAQIGCFTKSLSKERRDYMPAILPLVVGTTLGVFMSAIILLEKPVIILPVFITVVIYRSFMYAIAVGLISEIYPSEYFNTLYSIMFLISGISCILQYGFFDWAYKTSFYEVNVFLLAMTAATYVYPVYLCVISSRAERAARQRVVALNGTSKTETDSRGVAYNTFAETS